MSTTKENGVAIQTKIAMINRWRWPVIAASIMLTRNAHPRNVKIIAVVRFFLEWVNGQYKLVFIYIFSFILLPPYFFISRQNVKFSSYGKVPPPGPGSVNCKDKGKHCSYWKKQEYCKKGKGHLRYMKTNCKKSCNFCDEV